MKRVSVAIGIAAAIYALALGAGTLLYATGTIATGATHNNCAGFKQQIAAERGISEQDVPQSEVNQRTQQCLDQHTLSKRDAFRSEYLFWALWPAVICALIFLVWPRWTRILLRQHDAENTRDASNLERLEGASGEQSR